MAFTLQNPWSRDLFIALCRSYELKPYRYRRQRRTTVNVKAPKSFIDGTLWPELCAIDSELMQHIEEITQRIIRSAIHGDGADAGEAGSPCSTSSGG